MNSGAQKDIIQQLQREVLSLQRGKAALCPQPELSHLGVIEYAFPNRKFPTAAVHEFISPCVEDATATNGFISGILNNLMQKGGNCLWVSTKRTLFPPALKLFGIDPDRVIFIDLTRPKEALWVIEEGLKCSALNAVIGELQELSFTESRRLQLAVEESRVTGFIHRCQPRSENTVACVSRWKIKQLVSITEEGMPGVGLPRWNVHLAKVRNGKPGSWQVEWADNSFRFLARNASVKVIPTLKTG